MHRTSMTSGLLRHIRSTGEAFLLVGILTMVMAGCRHPMPVPKVQESREAMREILFKDGRLIGQPLSVRQPDVRVVRVESVQEADSIFHAMCLGQKVIVRMYKGDECQTCYLPPHYGGSLHYHHIPLSGWRLAGTVLVSSPRLNGWGVKEIRFVETVK